jgi:hypothetical protein
MALNRNSVHAAEPVKQRFNAIRMLHFTVEAHRDGDDVLAALARKGADVNSLRLKDLKNSLEEEMCLRCA